MAKFEKGETAVLKNISGSRLFEVYADDGETVMEKSSFASQQPYALQVRYHELVKVPDRETAEFIVAETKRAHEAYRAEEQRQKRIFEKTCRELFEQFGE